MKQVGLTVCDWIEQRNIKKLIKVLTNVDGRGHLTLTIKNGRINYYLGGKKVFSRILKGGE